MKRLVIVLMFLLMVLTMAQCRKNIVPSEAESPVISDTMIDVTLCLRNNDSKTEISDDGAVIWKKDDIIYVVGVEEGYLGSLTAMNDGKTVYFVGQIKAITQSQKFHYYYIGSNTFPTTGNYVFNLKNQDGTLADIATNNHLMHGVSENNVNVGQHELEAFSMESMIAIATFNFTRNDGEALTSDIICGDLFTSATLDIKNGSFSSTSKSGNIILRNVTSKGNYYMALIPGSQSLAFYQDAVVNFMAEKNVEQNIFYSKGFSVEMGLPEGALKGRFSIGSEKTVLFSKGNLQYIGEGSSVTGDEATAPYWRFANNQCDFMGCNDDGGEDRFDGNVSYITLADYFNYCLDDKHKGSCRDWFAYGTTGIKDTQAGCDEQHWDPWIMGVSEHYGPRPTYNDLSVERKSDWGCLQIVNGCNRNCTWRTLSSDEWNYLLFTRGDDKRGYGTVNNDPGIILIPDKWTAPSGYSFIHSSGNWVNSPDNWIKANTYNTTQWSEMENSGAVFLPFARRHNGKIIDPTNGEYAAGYYRSSYAPSNTQSTIISISKAAGSGVVGDYYGISIVDIGRHDGCSVRLIYDIK